MQCGNCGLPGDPPNDRPVRSAVSCRSVRTLACTTSGAIWPLNVCHWTSSRSVVTTATAGVVAGK